MIKPFNPWLDFCRASAIILVMLSHGRMFLTPIIPIAQNLKFGGFIGVELFFVLSGFLIGKIIFEKTHQSKSSFDWIPPFWFRRWMRTYPSYFLFLLLNLMIIESIRPEGYPNLYKYFTFTQSLTSPHPEFFGEAWSLAIEEIFYFLFPITIASYTLLFKNKTKALLFAVATILMLSFSLRVFSILQTQSTFNEIRSTALYRLDSLMIGVIFSWAFIAKNIKKIAMLGVLLFPLSAYLASKPDAFMDESVFLKLFLFDMASLGSACLIITFYKIKLVKPFELIFSKIARWSYAAYLTNLPVLYAINYFIPRQSSLLGCFVTWALFIVITISISRSIYHLFEIKVLALRDRLIS